jgi:hypothetical protein
MLFTSLYFAQNSQIRRDSLRKQFEKDSAYIFRPTFAKPYLRIENRYSFINKRPVNLAGFLTGATLDEKHIVCAGYYTLNRRTQKAIELVDNNRITREYLSLNYFVLCYQYILINRRYVQVNLPLEVGYGLYKTKTTDAFNNFLRKSNGDIVPFNGGIHFIFKPITWVGISAVGGYRHVVQERNIQLDFKGFYYSFGIWVDARFLYRHSLFYLKKRTYKRQLRAV